jgi:Fe-S-cluster containining protein
MFSQIVLSDFKKSYQYFPILFIKGELGYIKPVILLSNGSDHCPYIQSFKCSIYENRPTICKAYPLSAHITNDIFYDTTCPGVCEEGFDLYTKGQVSPHFYSEIFDDYQDKYIQTHLEMEKINKTEDFQLIFTLKNNLFYKYIGNEMNPYISMHKESLKHLEKYNLF